MTLLSGLLALLLFGGAATSAQLEEPEHDQGRAVVGADDEALIRDMRARLRDDPQLADGLASRILRSRIADRITGASDPQTRFQKIRQWIDSDPESAAGLGVGLARDDAEGSDRFESAVTRTIRTRLQENPGAAKGIFGRLKRQGRDSKLLKAQSEDISDEEKREILKAVFEGRGAESSKVITQEQPAGSPSASAAAGLKSGYYDRLSQNNLRGYSPDLQVLQSSLNRGRVPGAPKLIETGKLDFATLHYPAWGMRYDFGNLERRLRYERNYALAKLQGLERTFSAAELLSPEVEARLRSPENEKKLSPRLARRLAILEHAGAAVADFEAAALPAKDPSRITKGLLLALSARQKEAARWITIASLEEELQRLETERGFLTPELQEKIERAPVSPEEKAAYRRRGAALEATVKALFDNDEAAIRALEAEDWLNRIASVEKRLAQNGPLRRHLSRNIATYSVTARRFAAKDAVKSSWRAAVERALMRLLPASSYARRLRLAQRQQALLKEAFLKIASGDMDAASALLAQSSP